MTAQIGAPFMSENRRLTHDFLAVRPIRKLLLSPGFPVVVQVFVLGILGVLAWNGWGIGLVESAEELKTLRKTNLTTLIVWGLWWPAMIALALAFGRIWCTVCPMELVNRVADGFARRVGYRRLHLSGWLRAGWFVLVAYLVLQILVAGVSIHRIPHYTSILLISLFATALLTGLAFREPRSFCKSFCPAGALLSVYGRYTPIQLEIRDPELCSACKEKNCAKPGNRSRPDAGGCPSQLLPYAKGPSDPCVLCFQCVKACPHDNIGFGLVREAPSPYKSRLLRPFEAGFVMLAAGFVAHEVIGEIKWLDKLFHFVPFELSSLFPSVKFGWFEAAWFLLLFPALLWSVTAGLAYLLGYRGRFRSLLLAAATGAAPVVAIAHLAKAVAKITSWGGFLPSALRDPVGMETFRHIREHVSAPPEAFTSLSVLGWTMLVLICVVGWRAWKWIQQIPAGSLPAARAGLAGTAMFFTGVLVLWAY